MLIEHHAKRLRAAGWHVDHDDNGWFMQRDGIELVEHPDGQLTLHADGIAVAPWLHREFFRDVEQEEIQQEINMWVKAWPLLQKVALNRAWEAPDAST